LRRVLLGHLIHWGRFLVRDLEDLVVVVCSVVEVVEAVKLLLLELPELLLVVGLLEQARLVVVVA